MITACIINHNGLEYLPETLAAVLGQSDQFGEILLIDNASIDGSREMVQTTFPQIRIVPLAENLGPAGGRNVAFRCATGDWILFVDNDIRLTAECLPRLLAALQENPRAIAAMPRVVYAGRPHRVQYDGAKAHYLGLMTLVNENGVAGSGEDRVRKIGSLVSACFLLDCCRWKQGLPFDDAFFIYFDDHDFALQARLQGHELLSVPAAVVYHREGTSGLSLRKHGSYSSLRVTLLIRNRWQILLKYYALRTIIRLAPMLLLYELSQFAVAAKKGWLKEWFTAVCWILGNLNSIKKKRRNLQCMRRMPDGDIFEGGALPFTPYLLQSRTETLLKEGFDNVIISYWERIKCHI